MNMQKALRKLYKAISGEDNYKVNISKLLIDIHYALTGKTPVNKNNHARIISELADNWTGSGGGGGGGGSSEFSTAEVTIVGSYSVDAYFPMLIEADTWGEGQPPFIACFQQGFECGTYDVLLYKGALYTTILSDYEFTYNGDIVDMGDDTYLITGDCTITIS